MNKKMIALYALITSANLMNADYGYPAEQGCLADRKGYHHKHHHEDKISDEADQHRLAVLDKEEADASFYTNLARGGMATGAVLVLVGTLSMDKNLKTAGAGAAIFTIAAISAYGIGNRDDGRAILRAKERKDILDRRSKRHSH